MLIPPETSFINICGFPVYYYGIIVAVAVFAGTVISNKIALKEYFMPNIVYNIATSIIIGGIIGARLYYCLLNFNQYFANPIEIFALREGGLSIHGAILGGLIVLVYQAKANNINFLKLCDIFSVGLPLAQSIGRWGNFFNMEAFGLPTNLPWGMYVKQALRPDKYFYENYFHPTFLYESICDFAIFLLLYLFVIKKYKNSPGITFGIYLIAYSVVRFFIEYIRIDCTKYVCSLAVPQIVSLFMFVVGLSIILLSNIRQKNV